MFVIGVDGWKKGWVAALYRPNRRLEIVTARSLVDLAGAFPEANTIGVDMPIGLPAKGRAADREARAFVGPRRSSVFATPPRQVLEAPSHEAASALAQKLIGKGISRQSYGLRHKIFEIDGLARQDRRIVEIHPEVSFCALGGRILGHNKRTWNGSEERRRLLEEAGFLPPSVLDGEAGSVPVDDVLDAAVVAWSALRVAQGIAVSLPDPPELDEQDLPTAIWY